MRRPAAALLAVGLLAACASAESLEPSEGGAGDPCYPNGTCNAALVCVGNQCVAPDGGATAGGGTGGGAGGATGGSSSGGGGTGGSTGGAGGTGGASGAPPPPGAPSGCTTCGCCDPWLIKWTASAGATHYNVIWKCSIFPQHVINVGNVVQADLCSSTVGMCASSECANGVGVLQVQACNASGCSAATAIPSGGVPIACGGGCCC